MRLRMEERAAELLSTPEHRLFAHGGCHVFAITLSAISGLPLLWVAENGGNHDHVGCAPDEENFLDVFATFSRSDYIRAKILENRRIEFRSPTVAETERRFVTVRGPGYYAHPNFVRAARLRAERWIADHRDYFDGKRPIPIPGLARVERASDLECDALFDKRGA